MAESLTFSNPKEELEYLRAKVLEAEKKIESTGASPEREAIIRDSLSSHKQEVQTAAPAKQAEAASHAETILKDAREVELGEMMQVTETKGVFHALSVVEKLAGWRLEDDFHDFLVRHVAQGLPVSGVKEKGPMYQALHMTLYEVLLPKSRDADSKPLSELVKSMEQLYAGLLSLESDGKESDHMAFEIANPEGEEETRAFVSVPTGRKDLFERQMHAIFPSAKLHVRERDYNIFSDTGVSLGSSAELSSSPAYPFKTFEDFTHDPLNVILNGFSKLPAMGAGA
ncbi:MAG: hypothetical protein Q8O98_01080, partial [bacterium]|nr:hypothetical protein [bacterium]